MPPCPLDIPPFSQSKFRHLLLFELRKWGEKRGADFYCHKDGLVIELDGDVHDKQMEEDARRDKALAEMGLRILRFRNEEVVRDLSAVLRKVRELISI